MNKSEYNTKNYDIDDTDNLNFIIEENSNKFILKYFIIVNEYINLYIDNIYDNISINVNKKYRYYIFIKGLEIITNIIHILLIYTNNFDLVIHYCHKAYYYYIEFISQIDNGNNYLELNTKDSIIFVYKKTIFNIKDNINSINKSNINQSNIKKIKNVEKIIDIINTFIKIFVIKDILNLNIHRNNRDLPINICILKILNKINNNYTNEYNFGIYLDKLQEFIDSILKIINKINIISSDNYNIDNSINFQNLIILIDKIICKLYEKDINNINKINFNNIITLELLENLNMTKIKNFINKIF